MDRRPSPGDTFLRAGIGDFVRFQLQFGLRRSLFSYYITRCLEYPFAFNRMELKPGMRVLDFGCGDSLFPVYLAYRGMKTDCLDIVRSPALRFLESLKKTKLRSLLGDALTYTFYAGEQLPYKPGQFDRIFAVSTLEHLRGGGDSHFAGQFRNFLKEKGRAFVSVEFCSRYHEIFPPQDASVDFVRYYDREALFQRIIRPSGLKLVRMAYFGSPRVNIRRYADRFACTGFASPLFARLFYRELTAAKDLERTFLAFPGYLSNIIACMVLEKD